MHAIAASIAPLFIIILAAAILGRFLRDCESLSVSLNRYAVNIGLPALIFLALSGLKGRLLEHAAVIAANSLKIVGCFLAALAAAALFRLDRTRARTVFFCLGYGNVLFLGIPVLSEVYGPGILPQASLIVGTYLWWFFTVGVGVLQLWDGQDRKAAFRDLARSIAVNPLLIAVLAGSAAAVAGPALPRIAIRTLEMVSASVTPVALVVIGLYIGQFRFGGFRTWVAATIQSAAMLFLVPAAFAAVLSILEAPTAKFAPSILQAAMPQAIVPFVLADRYGLDKGLIARTIVISTIFSAFSIPFWGAILQ